ncbi:MAG TPA: hypothetical protein VH641_21315 [Streptosporangiaceae bacterium]
MLASYRGVPYEAGVGPSGADVVLFAACPPPEELGFEPATGHWRKNVIRAEIDALWESRPVGMFRGEPCIVLDDLGDRLHIAYLGDPHNASKLGYWQIDRGVFELLTPREDVTGLTEERVDRPLRLAASPAEAAPDTGPAYPYRSLTGPAAPTPDGAGSPAGLAASGGPDSLGDLGASAAGSRADLPAPNGLGAAAPGRLSQPDPLDPRTPVPEWPEPAAAEADSFQPEAAAYQPAPPALLDAPAAPPGPLDEPAATPGLLDEPAATPGLVQPDPGLPAPARPEPAPPGPGRREPTRAGGPAASGLAASGPAAPAPAVAAPSPTASGRATSAPPEPDLTQPLPAGRRLSPEPPAPPSHDLPTAAEPAPPAPPAPMAQTATTAPLAPAARRVPAQRESASQEMPRLDPPSPAVAKHGPAHAGGRPKAADNGGRAARRQRVATRDVFCELADLAAIPRAAYALEAEVDGVLCLLPTATGYEVFVSADGARHEVRTFADEEAAYFYLFGVLAAEAIRNGVLTPAATHDTTV